ncbi:MAG: hypothetical protein EAZ35_09005 [Sphingobacteriia bacterium]|nr:MAG: hypothetical protein EAZ35_09005 [Sphingobacteriia bacterium]
MEIQNSEKYPRMYVDPITASKRQNWHFINKFLPLSKALGKPAFIDAAYSMDDFKALHKSLFKEPETDAVRIYIATYPDDVASLDLETKYAGTLTTIYAPCKLANGSGGIIFKEADPRINYIIHPYKGLMSIIPELANSLIDNYRNAIIKLPLLTQIVHDLGGNKSETDTRSILHLKEDFDELLSESLFQQADYIQLKLTSYTHEETSVQGKEYLCRLTTAYELLDAAGRVIDITLRTRTGSEKKILTDDFNNGTLCPPKECGD